MSKLDEIKLYYDKYANVYDTKHGVVLAGQNYNFKKYYLPFLDRWVPTNGNALELGCGTGVYTEWLSGRGCTVDAMDISQKMINQAQHRCPNARFFTGDCEDPAKTISSSVPPSGYDVIVGINTISYYVDKKRTLQRLFELLKPGGSLVVIDMNGASIYYDLMTFLGINEMRQWSREISESNASNLQSMLNEANFILEDVQTFAFIPNGLSAITVALLKPIDHLLGALPFIQSIAMRVAYSARKPV